MIDIILIGILILSSILGYIRGFINEFMRIFVWIGSVFGAYYVYFYHLDLLPKMNPLLTIILLFICFLIILKLLQAVLDNYIKTTFLNFINQPFGLFYGIARGFIIVLSIGHSLEHFKMESKFVEMIYEKSAPYVNIKQQEEDIICYSKKNCRKIGKRIYEKMSSWYNSVIRA